MTPRETRTVVALLLVVLGIALIAIVANFSATHANQPDPSDIPVCPTNSTPC